MTDALCWVLLPSSPVGCRLLADFWVVCFHLEYILVPAKALMPSCLQLWFACSLWWVDWTSSEPRNPFSKVCVCLHCACYRLSFLVPTLQYADAYFSFDIYFDLSSLSFHFHARHRPVSAQYAAHGRGVSGLQEQRLWLAEEKEHCKSPCN